MCFLSSCYSFFLFSWLSFDWICDFFTNLYHLQYCSLDRLCFSSLSRCFRIYETWIKITPIYFSDSFILISLNICLLRLYFHFFPLFSVLTFSQYTLHIFYKNSYGRAQHSGT
jgi:hypothetical protein